MLLRTQICQISNYLFDLRHLQLATRNYSYLFIETFANRKLTAKSSMENLATCKLLLSSIVVSAKVPRYLSLCNSDVFCVHALTLVGTEFIPTSFKKMFICSCYKLIIMEGSWHQVRKKCYLPVATYDLAASTNIIS